MLNDKPIAAVGELPKGFRAEDAEPRAGDSSVLMVSPDHFRVDYVINPHMHDAAGRPNVVDRPLAQRQWAALKALYEKLGYRVDVLDGVASLPDMVFAANQSFPFVGRDGRRRVLISAMARPERRGETAAFERWYGARGFEIRNADPSLGSIEGMGDALWVPGRRLLLVGHGFRTSPKAAAAMAEIVETPVVLLELVDDRFYHLDTAAAPIDATTCLAFRRAFTPAGWELLNRVFARVIEVSESEAVLAFACNAHSPDARRVILEPAAVETRKRLEALGFGVETVDVSEFRKSGGSIFCMKMMIP